ncbi:MAG: phosphoribulokinase [Solirubrobacterales bacterium]|nr:phosphoribulokinase [Solirubrobacterales bacterium]
MARPIILGIVGDSAAGKTTISTGLVSLLSTDNVTHVSADDYHRYDRRQRAELQITPLHPDCNYLDVLGNDLLRLRAGEPILKPVYDHADGTFGPPEYVRPARFTVVEGLLGYHTEEMREAYDVRVYLAPPEHVRRTWKVKRDTANRGYTTDEVLSELERREVDSEAFIRPQRRHADLVVSFVPPRGVDEIDPGQLDAELTLRDGLPHPDLSPFIDDEGMLLVPGSPNETCLRIAGRIEPDQATQIEEAIWEKMHFASHLRTQRLGEFTIGSERHRSSSLGIVQLLILFHMATAKAIDAVGGEDMRADIGRVGFPAAR